MEIGILNINLKNLITEFDPNSISSNSDILILIPNYRIRNFELPNYRIRNFEFNSNSISKSKFFDFVHSYSFVYKIGRISST